MKKEFQVRQKDKTYKPKIIDYPKQLVEIRDSNWTAIQREINKTLEKDSIIKEYYMLKNGTLTEEFNSPFTFGGTGKLCEDFYIEMNHEDAWRFGIKPKEKNLLGITNNAVVISREKHTIILEKQPKDETTLNVYDVDGTLIDTHKAIDWAQAKHLATYTGKDPDRHEMQIKAGMLNELLEEHNINKNEFFKTYKTPNPYEREVRTRMNTYLDTSLTLRLVTGIKAAISNSSQQATEDKLHALNQKNYLDYILAEYEEGKNKPNAYMAEKLFEQMADKNEVNSIKKIINIGDKPVDMEFEKGLWIVFSDWLGRNIDIQSYLIDRKDKHPESETYTKIKSLMEIDNYVKNESKNTGIRSDY